MINKILNAILFICLPIYVVMTSYYTMLFFDELLDGFLMTFLLTILPTLAGIFFGVALKTLIDKKLNKQKS